MTVQQQDSAENPGAIAKSVFYDLLTKHASIFVPGPGQEIWPLHLGRLQPSETGLYLLLEGTARLLNSSMELIATLPANTSFGEIALFPQAGFIPYSVRATQSTRLGFLGFDKVLELCQAHPGLRDRLYEKAVRWDFLFRAEQQGLFREIDRTAWLALVTQSHYSQIKPGPILPSPSRDARLYFIHRGQVSNQQGQTYSTGAIFESVSAAANLWTAQAPTVLVSISLSDLHSRTSSSTGEVNKSPVLLRSSGSRTVDAIAPTKDAAITAHPSPRHVATPSSTPQSYFPTPQRQVRQYIQGILKQYPFIKQQSQMDCGVACIAIVGAHWGKRLSINHLRELANVGREGTTLRGLMIAAEAVGFTARPVKGSVKNLAKQSLPAIVHWEGNHYVVIFKLTRQHVYISDPAMGRRRLTAAEFSRGWTGYAVLLEPTIELNYATEAKLNLWKYIDLFKKHRFVLVEVLICTLVLQVFGICMPLFTQQILDRVVVQNSQTGLLAIGSGLFLFSVFQLVMKSLRRYLLFHTTIRIDLSLAVGFISHAFRLPTAYFDARYVGDIMSRIGENKNIRSFLSGELLFTILDLCMVVFYCGLMFWYSWSLAFIALGLIPIMALITFVSTPILKRMSQDIFSAKTKEESFLIEAFTGISTVKSMGMERRVRWRWENFINQTTRLRFKRRLFEEQLSFATSFVNSVGRNLLFLFGVYQVLNAQLTIGQLIAFNMIVESVYSPFESLISLWGSFQEVLISVERINDVMEAQPEEPLTANLPTLPDIKGHIQFQNVTFRYSIDCEANTLENINFEIRPGETVALVGRSGSGKTTLAKLLMGLYPLNSGRILLDGFDVASLAKESFRQQIGVVDQNTFLFGGTIRENIAISNPDAPLADVQEAARLAGAASFIENFPLQYDTLIGEDGGLLSGGQRQRLAIARALLKNPRLFIFDEATSSLDPESERVIQRHLDTILKDRTTLVIAHRLSTVRNADKILVLDRGVVVESGTHRQLMKSKGHYFYLNQQQLEMAH